MDAKDLRTEAALGDRNNDGNSKYAQGGAVLPCNRTKPYHDIGSNSLAKVDVQTARPCAVIGPDRVVPPPVSNDAYIRKGPAEPWLPMDSTYRRPPDYPHKMVDYQHPTRNISPRQTFQENMQRIMVPPSYTSGKQKDDHIFPVDSNISTMRSNKLNMPSEAKYCDVPYVVNPMINEQKNIRNDVGVINVNSALTRSGPHPWPPGASNVRPPKPYGVPELYQYPDYSSCAGPRPMLMTRQHRTVHEEPGQAYSEPFYHEGSIRFKPYPSVKERYPQSRYEYITNHASPFHPPPPFPSHKYDLQKQMAPLPYPGYPPVPLKYLEARMSDQIMNGYQRTPNQQANFNNVPFRNQVIPPTYGAVPGSCLQPNKFYPYPPDNSVKSMASNKLPYDTNSKLYAEYENSRAKAYPMSEGFYVNEITRPHPMKGQVMSSNYPPTMHPHPYYRKENPGMKNYELAPHFRNFDPSVNINGNPLSRFPSQFSPNTIAISPSDSNASNDTNQTQGTLQEDCGYVSQSSSASVRSLDSGINRIPYDMYRRYDYGYGSLTKTSSSMSKFEPNPNNNNGSKDKKNIDVRQFLQMWNEGEDENIETKSKEVNVKVTTNNTNEINNQFNGNNQEQLYVLGLVNVPCEELDKYDHIQKVSKLPENIKGYNSLEILNKFEAVIESSNLNNFNTKPKTPRDFQISYKGSMTMQGLGIPSRPISPLDVEAKISQSVIHKEVGCNFEIKPCSPKMLNVEVATAVQTIVDERIIEKVTNPLIKQSSSLLAGEGNTESCNVMKCQDQRISVTDKSKIPSCKMINTLCSSNEPLQSPKTNYSLQDFESSSGVCLASLPRLDNDIELNFPEVNQQFINANKVESVITLPTLDVDQPEIKDQVIQETESNQCPSKNEKELSKLSKYRKLKKNSSESKDSTSEPNAQAMRKDSVIKKNPENTKGQEEYNEKSYNRPKNNLDEAQQKPMNLTVYSENRINTTDSDLYKPKEFAIDFSLNSNGNYGLVNNSENTKRNFDKILTLGDNTSFYEEKKTNDDREICPSLYSKLKQSENYTVSENIKFKNTETSSESHCKVTAKSESSGFYENRIESDAHIELLIPRETESKSVNHNSDLMNEIKHTDKNTDIEDIMVNCTSKDESNRNTKSPSLDSDIARETESKSLNHNSDLMIEVKHIEKNSDIKDIVKCDSKDESDINTKSPSLDSEIASSIDNLNKFDYKNSLDIFPTSSDFISCPNGLTENKKIECITIEITTQGNKQKTNEDIEDKEKMSCLPTPTQFNVTEFSNKLVTSVPCDNEQRLRSTLKSNNDKSFSNFQDDLIISNKSQSLHYGQMGKINENECGNITSNENISRVKKELFSPRIQNLILYHNGFCKTDFITSNLKSNLLSDKLMATNSFSEQHELAKTNDCNNKLVAEANMEFEQPYDVAIPTIENTKMESVLKKKVECRCEDQIAYANVTTTTEKDENKLEVKSVEVNTKVIIEHIQHDSVDANMQISETAKTENNTSCTDLNETTENNKHNFIGDQLLVKNSIAQELDKDRTDSCIIQELINNEEHYYFKESEPAIVDNEIPGNTLNINNYAANDKINSIKTELISVENYVNNVESSTNNFTPTKFSLAPTINPLAQDIESCNILQITDENKIDDEETKSGSNSDKEYDYKTCRNKNEKFKHRVENPKLNSSNIITDENTTSNNRRNIIDLPNEMISKDIASDIPTDQNISRISSGGFELPVDGINDNLGVHSTLDEKLTISLNNPNNAANITANVMDNEIDHEVFKSSQKLVESSDREMENVKFKDPQFNKGLKKSLNINSAKGRRCLKRSLSDSALVDMRDISKQEVSESNFLWPNKRKKIFEPENITELIAQNYCNIIQHNRRNSISSIYNEENVSFCILIEDNCIVTEDCDDTEKICFTEIPEDCLSCIPSNHSDTSRENEPEMIPFQEEINCDYSNPFASDFQEEDQCRDESWVEDVACVETVFSDDVAEDIVIRASPSSKDPDSSNDECDSETGIYDVNNHTEKVKYIYGEKMCINDAKFVETLYRTPQMNVNKTLINKESQIIEECIRYYDKDSLEKVLSESNSCEETSSAREEIAYNTPSLFNSDIVKNYTENENVDKFGCYNSIGLQEKDVNVNINSDTISKTNYGLNTYNNETQDDTIHSCESSVDNVFSYSKREESPKCTISSFSSSPEVSSTTSEERNSSIFLKITNYGGSRVSEINDIHTDNNINKSISCKYTENIDYLNTNNNLPSRPLITKAAQKYIPPLKETIPDLKVKLPLPHHSLIKLKQLKVSKDKPKLNVKVNNMPNLVNIRKEIPKKSKPKFEDVLKSIDEIQFQMHKDKTKKIKKSIPKVVIKKTYNGSHYASTTNKDKYNPDLTGRKWQPWVFLEKNSFIDTMALKKKTRAVFNHRKNTYVMFEKFKKYKSIQNAKFVITQPNLDDSSTGQLKYTIRLKHSH